MLSKEMLPKPAHLYNGLALAYMGDAVFEIYVRRHLLALGTSKAHLLHVKATAYVSAKAQAKILGYLLEQELLTEKEMEMVKRGRNAKIHTSPKHTELKIYRQSTAFESLLGYLYLNQEMERLEELIETSFTLIEKGGDKHD